MIIVQNRLNLDNTNFSDKSNYETTTTVILLSWHLASVHFFYILNIMNFKTCKVILNFNKNIFFRFNSNFVPKHSPVQLSDANTLDCFIKEHKNILVLTGIMCQKCMF